MPLTLSLNTNPLVNRFAEPEDLLETIARDIRIARVQLTHEFINPSWPAATKDPLVRRMQRASDNTGVRITSCMTGPYGRLNHFGHPIAEVRAYYIEWFKSFADIAAALGASSVGSQFAIFTYKDFDSALRREEMMDIALQSWAEVAEHAKAAGLDFLFWEPMSVGRECGETLQQALELQQRIDATNLAIPLRMLADIDHGDITSPNPEDYNPYAWARSMAQHSPIIHIKQRLPGKTGHHPFISAYNTQGAIQPQRLLEALQQASASDNEICLELQFKEREPQDRQVVEHIAESVGFWRPYIDSGEEQIRI